MKYKLTITTDEKSEVIEAVDWWKYKAVLLEISDWLRNKEKYEPFDTVSLTEVRGFLVETLTEHNINLYND
jgi:hypothetical protein